MPEKMSRRRLTEKISYRFDNIMSKGLVAVVGLLTVSTLAFLAIVSAVVAIFGLLPPRRDMDYFEVYWAAVLRTLDAGTMGNDEGFGFRIAMFIVTIGGVIVVASLIGAISNAFTNRVDTLRKGRSRVVENDHTLILGWNSKIFSIIKEIEIANESIRRPAVVILAQLDKVWMEDEIHAHLPQDRNTRIVIRSGDPLSLTDVGIGSPETAKSIIILAPNDAEDPDAISIKTCLALLNHRNFELNQPSIVAEISDPQNLDAAQLVGGDKVKWIHGQDLISRLIVQTCRQSGLSSVFTELLDFEGSELYVTDVPSRVGTKFKDAALGLSRGCALGVLTSSGVHLNPSPSFKLEQGSRLIVIAEDDSAISFGEPKAIDRKAISSFERPAHKAEKTLILGANENLESIVQEMSNYMPKGSSACVVAASEVKLTGYREGFSVTTVVGDHTSRRTLSDLTLSDFNHIVVLAESNRYSVQHCDSRTLLTLLHLRELAKLQGLQLNIVSEMLDDKNRELAESTDADDFIVSDKLVSLMIAQISQNPDVGLVFAEVLSSSGSEIRLHPVEWYVKLGHPVSFSTVVAAAMEHYDTAIGYQIAEDKNSDHRLHGLTLNPDREAQITFRPGDRIAVLTDY